MMHEEATAFSEAAGWKRFKTTKLAEIWRKTGDSSPVQKIKVREDECFVRGERSVNIVFNPQGSLLFPGIPHTAGKYTAQV